MKIKLQGSERLDVTLFGNDMKFNTMIIYFYIANGKICIHKYFFVNKNSCNNNDGQIEEVE
jgi:hypothetical protein